MSGYLRKIQRYGKSHELARRVTCGIAAAGIFMQPFMLQAVYASEIQKEGSAEPITGTDGVFSVFADKVNGDNAVSVFSKFDLTQGDIANMYFGLDKNGDASNLYNFVNDHININGTVNAIRGGKLGGNIFFISSDGITVGSTGVINAGTINMVTPVSGDYSSLKGDALNKADFDLGSRMDNGMVSINPEGTIQVEGRMNAVDGIRMQSANINLQGNALVETGVVDFSNLVNLSDEQKTAAGFENGSLTATQAGNGDIVLTAVADGATGSFAHAEDFWDVRKATVTADSGTQITANGGTGTGKGDVKISATAKNSDIGWYMDENFDITVENPLGNIVKTEASIDLNGKIHATNTIDVKAASSNEYNSLNDTAKISDIVGDITHLAHWGKGYNIVKRASDILNVDVIYSHLESKAEINVGEDAELKADAAFDVGKNAVNLEATSDTTNVVQAATSSADTAVLAPRSLSKDTPTPAAGSNRKKTTHIAGAAVVYGGAHSEATVNVDGKIEADGSINAKAKSTDAIVAKSNANGSKGTNTGTAPKVNISIVYADGTNSADVTFGKGSSIKSSEGNVTAAAAAANSIDAAATVTANSEALGSTAISIMTFDSDAKVDLKGTVEANNGAVAASATNQTARDNVTAANGMNGAEETKTKELSGEAEKNGIVDEERLKPLLDDVAEIADDIDNKIDDTTGNGSKLSRMLKEKTGYDSLLTAGVSIAVGEQDFDAKVNVGSAADISGGAVSLTAKEDLQDFHMSATGNMQNKNSKDETMISADGAILIALVDNNASVNIDSRNNAEHRHAKITALGAGGIVINAQSTQEYDRLAGLWGDIEKIYGDFGKFIDAVKDDPNVPQEKKDDLEYKVQKFGEAVQYLRSGIKKSTGLDVADYTVSVSSHPTTLTGAALTLLSLAAGIEQSVASLSQGYQAEAKTIVKSLENQVLMFLTPEKYANFAASSAVGTAAEGSITAAGSFNLNLLDNNARVSVGNGAVLTANAGPVVINSEAKQTNVVMNGKANVTVSPEGLIDSVKKAKNGESFNVGNIIQMDKSNGVAVGGSLGVSEHSTTNIVDIGADAEITGMDGRKTIDTGEKDDDDNPITRTDEYSGITIKADNQNITTDVSYSAGHAGKAGFEGLFSWMGGEAKNNISIDETAKLDSHSQTSDFNTEKRGIDIEGDMNVVGTNLVGAVAWSSGAVSMGAADGMSCYDIDNIVHVRGNLSIDGTSHSGAADSALDINALTDGVINTITLAGALTTTKEPDSKAQTAGEILGDDETIHGNNDEEGIEDRIDIELRDVQENVNENVNEVNENDNITNPRQNEEGKANAKQDTKAPKLYLSGAGSASVNIINTKTEATLKDAKVTATGDGAGASVRVKAEDAAFVGAWSGSAAVNWKQSAATKAVDEAGEIANKETENTRDTEKHDLLEQPDHDKPEAPGEDYKAGNEGLESYSVAMAGAAAINSAVQTVNAKVEDTTFNRLDSLTNIAQKDGALVAAGLAVAVNKEQAGSKGAAIDAAGSASINVTKADITAKLSNIEVTDKTDRRAGLNNYAFDSDTQVTGGANTTFLMGGKMGVGAGGSAAIADITNDITAEMDSVKLHNEQAADISNLAATDLTQVTTAIGVSASVGAEMGANFNGALAGSFITNNDSAEIIDLSVGKGGLISNQAADTNNLSKHFDKVIQDNGLDPTGVTYSDNVSDNAATTGENSVTISTDDKSSTLILTAAMDAVISTGKKSVGGAGAAAVSTIDNDKRAVIKDKKNRTITAEALKNEASSDAVLVNIAGGAAVSAGPFSGAGSASIQWTSNDVTASVEDADINVTGNDGVQISAETKDVDVNISGQISAGKNAAGLALAYNHLNNNTEAYLKGTTLNFEENTEAPLEVTAKDSGTVVSVTAGVGGGSTAAVQGAVAVNQGRNNVLAIVDEGSIGKRSSISKAKSIDVSAKDTGVKVAVAGGLSGAGTAAVGGGVAYNEIGSWFADDDKTEEDEKHQQIKAALRHTDIVNNNTNNGAVSVIAEDKERIGTAAAGIGGAGTAAVQGAAATSVMARKVRTEVLDVDMNASEDSAKDSLTAKAEADGSIYNNAIVIAGSGTASVGAGVSVNYDGTDTSASVSSGVYKVTDLDVEAASREKIMNIGIGVAAAGNAGITGSVAVSVQTGDTVAQLGDTTDRTTVKSDSNVVVAAQSDRAIDVMAGTAAGAGEGAAVGLSVAVSDIQGDTKVIVEGKDTEISAKGGPEVKLNDTLEDNQLIKDYSSGGDAIVPGVYMDRVENTYGGGIILSSSAANKIDIYSANSGFAAVGGAVNGTVNVSTIGGSTVTEAEGAVFDAGTGDINVIAKDYANNFTAGGVANMAAVGGNVGLGSATVTINRNTEAALRGTIAGNDKTVLNANNAKVYADAEYGAANASVGIGITGVGGGVSNVDNITMLKGHTTAELSDFTDMTVGNTVDVLANRESYIHTIGIMGGIAGLGANVGLGVDVVQDKGKVESWIKNSSIKGKAVNVDAKNLTDDSYQMFAVNAGAGAVSGTVSVGNFDSSVSAQVLDSTLGEENNKIKDLTVSAENQTKVTPKNWSASAGAVALGAGVQVATIGSNAKAAVTGSTVQSSGDVTVAAKDERKADLMLGNTLYGGVSGGLNVGVLTVNHAVADKYSYESDEGETADAGVDLGAVYKSANEAIEGNRMSSDYTFGWTSDAPKVEAGRGMDAGQQPGGVYADVSGSSINAGDGVKVTADAVTNLTETSVNAALSGANFGGSVGVLDAESNTGIKANGANITAGNDITFANGTSGKSELNLYMGAAALATNLNGAVGVADSSANNTMTVENSVLNTAGGNISLSSGNAEELAIHAGAVNASMITGAIQVADAGMSGDTEISISNTRAEARKDGKGISVTAKNAPKAEAKTGMMNASLGASGGLSVVHVGIGDEDKPLETKLDVKNGSSFVAPEVSLLAEANVSETAILESIAGSLGENVITDVNHVDAYSNVTVNVEEAAYGAEETKTDLDIKGNNVLTQDSSAQGYDAGLWASFSNNVMKTKDVLNTAVNAKGAKNGSVLKEVSAAAASSVSNDSRSSSFGGGMLAEGAAVLKNDVTADTKTNLSGSWTVDGDLLASAVNKENLKLKADASAASVVNGSGTGYTDTTTENASVTNTAKIDTTGTQKYSAGVQADNTEHILASGFGALGGVNAGTMDQNHTYSNQVDFSGAELIADGDIKAAAAAKGSIDSKNFLDAGAGGLEVSVTDSSLETDIRNVVKASKSKFRTNLVNKAGAAEQGNYTNLGVPGGEIDFAAYDDIRLASDTIAKSEGVVAGVAVSDASNNLTRSNEVSLNSTEVLSSGNVGIYANRNINGGKAGTELELLSDSYNRTFLPFSSSASISSNVKNTNSVAIDKNSTVQSIGNIALAADNGKDSISQSSTEYRWFTDCDSEGTTKMNGDDSGLGKPEYNNSVVVDGSVTAGTHNKADVEITGDVKISGNESSGYKADMSGVKVNVKEGSDWLTGSDFKKGTITIDNGYYDRYTELSKMLQTYTTGTEEYNSYKAEMDALCEVMVQAGFAVKNGSSYAVAKSREAAAVVVPGMTVSGGNVEIESGKLTVTGNITANGSPEVKITNSSPTYLYVNDVVVETAGGDVTFNGKSLSGNDVPNGVTGSKKIKTSIGSEASGEITISNVCGPTDPLNQPDIGIYGNVTNKAGDVTISNDRYNIYVDKNATVSGTNIYMKADNGSVTQSNPNGIVMIGADPIAQYMLDHAEDIQKALDNWLRAGKAIPAFSTYSDYVNWVKSSSGLNIPVNEKASDPSAGIIANNGIFISGHEVNIGGLVQSGYDTYSVKLTDDSVAKVISLDSEWAKSKVNLSDSDVMSGTKYFVSDRGAYYDESAKCYKYHVGVYYNPSTQKLIVDDVKASGGQIFINGNVGSTGNGRIMAASGVAKIDVDTTAVSSRDLVLNNITNSSRNGYINITDTLQNKVFEYSNTGDAGVKGRSYDIGKTAGAWENLSETDMYRFSPKKNLTYQWTGGVSGQTVKTYEYVTTEWIGCIDYDSPTEMTKNMPDSEKEKIQTTSSTNNPENVLDTSSYLKEGSNGSKEFAISGTYSENLIGTSPVTHEVDKFALGWIYKEITSRWSETYGTASSTTYSVKADNDVSVGFLRADVNGREKPAIDVNAGGNLIVDGTISSATKDDYVGLSSMGSISGNGTIITNNLIAGATTGVDLTQTAKAARDSDGNSLASNISLSSTYGKISLDSKKGDITLVNARVSNAKLGTEINIHVADSIFAKASSVPIQAAVINLTSDRGSIGTRENALRINAGSTALSGNAADSGISAFAQEGIYLEQSSGDMRVNHIESRNGDVELFAPNGNIVDASDAESVSNTPSRVQSWTDAGLISAEDADNSKAKISGEIQESTKKNLEIRFSQLTGKMANRTVDGYKSAAAEYTGAVNSARSAYVQTLRSSAAADADKKAAKAAYEKAQKEFFDGKDYTEEEQNAIIAYSEAVRDDAVQAYGWTKNELLYAIKSSVINSDPGHVSLLDTANVKGRNVTLHANGIGADSEITVINKADIKNHLQELSQAHIGGVTKNYDENGELVSITLDNRQPLTYEVDESDVDNKGKITVDTAGHIYLATTAGKAMHLSSDMGTASQNVMLYAGNGIDSTGTVSAKDLAMYAGQGSIGSKDGAVKVNVTGTLSANSGDSIYAEQAEGENLTLRALAADNDIEISAEKDILMEKDGAGYINAGNIISLTSGSGSIGSDDSAVRILDNGVVINAAANKGNAYIAGTGNSGGNLVLGKIQSKELHASNDEGDIVLSKGEKKADISLNGDSSITAKNLNLTDGSIKEEKGTLRLEAENTIAQKDTENSRISTGENAELLLQTGKASEAGGSIDIGAIANTFEKASVCAADSEKGIEGNVRIISNAENGLAVTFGNGADTLKVTGGEAAKRIDVTVQNCAPKSDLTINGKLETTDRGIAFTSSRALTENADLTSDKNMVLAANENIVVNGALTAENGSIGIKSLRGSIEVTDKLTAEAVGLAAKEDISVSGGTSANNIKAETEGDVKLSDISAAGTLQANAGNDVTVSNSEADTLHAVAGGNASISDTSAKVIHVDAAGNAVLSETSADIMNLSAAGDAVLSKSSADNMNVSVDGNIVLNADVTAKDTANLYAGKSVEIGSSLNVNDLYVKAGEDITLRDGGTTVAESAAGNLTIDAGKNLELGVMTVSAGKNLMLRAGREDIKFRAASIGEINLTSAAAGENATIYTNRGAANIGTVTAGKNVSVSTGGGELNIGTAESAHGNVNLSTRSGEINTGDVEAANGNVNLSTVSGAVNVTGDINAGGRAVVSSVSGAINADGSITAGSIDITGGGNINANSLNSTGETFLSAGGGDVTVNKIDAGGLTAIHRGTGNVNLDESAIHGDGAVLHMGNGNVNLGKLSVGHEIDIAQLGIGDIVATGELKAGQRLELMAKNGNMDLKDVDGGNRLMILNYGKDKDTKADRLHADELITLYAINQDFGTVESPTVLDILLAGDQTRTAVGLWHSPKDADLIEFNEDVLSGAYSFRYDLLKLNDLIDFRSWMQSMPENAKPSSIQIAAASHEDDNEELLIALS